MTRQPTRTNVTVISVVLVAALAATACREGAEMESSIQNVKTQHEAELMAMPGVVSVGIGMDDDGNKVIVVGIDQDRTETRAQVPQTVEGYPVRVEVVGKMKAQ